MLKKIKIKFIKRFVRFIKIYFLNRISFQTFFDWLHRLSLAGMGYGNGSNIKDSGELNIIELLKEHFNGKKPVIFDVGARIGDYSLAILSAFRENVFLYSFEPSKSCFAQLKKEIEKHPNAKIFNIGLGSKKESVILYGSYGGKMNSIFSECLNPEVLRSPDVREEIDLTTIDIFCKEESVNKINFLKLDTEGNEQNILLGAKKLLDEDLIDFIQFEFSAANVNSRTYFRDFFRLLNPKFRIYRILFNGIVPMDAYKERYEIFAVTNFLAISRRISL